MIAIENNKTERGKLLAAIAVLALVACALVVVMPAGETDAETNSAVSAADNYTYEGYTYGGDRYVTDNTVTMVYGVMDASLITDNTVMNDFARFIGALYRADSGATVQSITYEGVEYTWKANASGEYLGGSNWRDADGVTLVSVVTADFVTAVSVDGGSVSLSLDVNEDSPVNLTYAVSGAIAQVGDTYYGTLEAAIAAAENNETVEIIADGNIYKRTVVEDKTIVINLNEHTLHSVSTTDGYILQVGDNANVTINGTGSLTNSTETVNQAILATLVGGTLTLNNVTIDATGYGIMAQGYQTANYTDDNEVLHEATHPELRGQDLSTYTGEYATNLIINNSTITSVAPTISTNGLYGFEHIVVDGSILNVTGNSGIYIASNAFIQITGTTINAASGIDQRSGTVNISGSTINYTGPGEDKEVGDGPTDFGVGIVVIDATGYSTGTATTIVSNVEFNGSEGTSGDVVTSVPRNNGQPTSVSGILTQTTTAARDGLLVFDGVEFSTTTGDVVGVSYVQDGNVTVGQYNTVDVNEDFTVATGKTFTLSDNSKLNVNATLTAATESNVTINGDVSVVNGGILDLSASKNTLTGNVIVGPGAEADIAGDYADQVEALPGSSVIVDGVTIPATEVDEFTSIDALRPYLEAGITEATFNGSITATDASAENPLIIIAGTTLTVTGSITGYYELADGASIIVGAANDSDFGGIEVNALGSATISGTVDGILIEAASLGSNSTAATVIIPAPAEGEDSQTVAVASGANIINFEVTVDTNVISISGATVGDNFVISSGSVRIDGEITLNGSSTSSVIFSDNATAGVLTLGDATISGTGNIQVPSLTVLGEVTIASGVNIIVPANGTMTISETGSVTGDGIITLAEGDSAANPPTSDGILTVAEGGIVGVEVRSANPDGVTVNDADQFISALEYADTITLGDDITFNDVDVEVTGKVINLNGHKITITGSAAVYLVNTEVNNGTTASGIDVTNGVLDIANSDVYTKVTITDDENGYITVSQPKVQTIGGTSVGNLGDVGYGNVLEITGDFTISNRNTLNVYGTLSIIGSLTAQDGSTVNIIGSGDIDVTGTLTMNGNLYVEGDGAVPGTMTVGTTGTLDVNGEFVVSGTATINGTLAGSVENHGSVTFAGIASTGAKIVACDGSTTVITSVEGTLDVTDKGAALELKPDNTSTRTYYSVDGNTVSITDMDAVAGSAGITIGVSVANETEGTVTTYVATMDVAGTANGNIALNGKENAGIVVSQTLDVNALTVNNAVVPGALSFSGPVDITGTVNAANGITVTNTGVLTVSGEMTLVGATAESTVLGGTVNATYYTISTAAVPNVSAAFVTGYYTSFDAAIQQIADADNDTITVMGEQSVGADATIAQGQTVIVQSGAEFTIGSGVTLTVATDGILRDNAYALANNQPDKGVFVDGTLTFQNFATGYTHQDRNARVFADVVVENAPARTYMSLAGAIGAGMTDITLNQDVIIESDLTIPAGTTVSSDEFGITVRPGGANSDVTLTVEGAVELTFDSPGFILGERTVTGTSGSTTYEGLIVIGGTDGYVMVPTTSNVPDITSVDEDDTTAVYDAKAIAGAHYLKEVTVDRQRDVHYVVSTLMHAADDSVNVYAESGVATITVTGQITVDSLEFIAPEEATLDVTMGALTGSETDSSLRFNQIVLGNSVSLRSDGYELTGAVVMQDTDGNNVSEVSLSRAVDVIIEVYTYTDPETGAESDRMGVNGTIEDGAVTISAGTVYAGTDLSFTNGTDTTTQTRYTGSLTVANGATFVVGPVSDFNITSYGTAVAMTVDGMLTFQENTASSLNGAVINGTVTITDDSEVEVGNVAVNGTIDVVAVDENDGSFLNVTGLLTVGSKPTELGVTAGAGTINGKVTIGADGIIKAYPGADLTSADLNVINDESDAVSTVFNINGETYMTVYVYDDADREAVADVLMAEEFDLLGLDVGLNYHDNGTATATQGVNTGLYQIRNWYSNESMAGNTALDGDDSVGAYDTVYAHAEPASVTGTYSVGVGLRLYVDDVPVTSSNTAELTVGTHTVRFEVEANYNGDDAVISFNGQTVQNNGTITIGVSDTTFNLTASGAVPATPGSGDITVNVPSQDDGMSLTDILLIVLVILIVIMAIIVALRLMRS